MPGSTASGQGRALETALRAADRALNAGRLDAAIADYRALVTKAPEFAIAWSHLGVALRARGLLDEAVEAGRRAIALAPQLATAHHQVAQTLEAFGRPMDALQHLFQAYRATTGKAPERPAIRQALCAGLAKVRLDSASPAVVKTLLELYEADDLSHQDLAAVSLSLLAADPGFQSLEAAGEDRAAADEQVNDPACAELLGSPHWSALLVQTLVEDRRLERMLRALRHVALHRLHDASGPHWLLGKQPHALAALACQAAQAEYVWPESDEEARAVGLLEVWVSQEAPISRISPDLLALALYRPVHRWWRPVAGPAGQAAPKPQARPWADPLETFRARHLDGRVREAERADKIAILGMPVNDQTSDAVRAQYEENPYPRWLSVKRQQPRPLRQVLKGLFAARFAGDGEADLPRESPTRILVAGCGTGAHAVKVASRYADADVLAIDLSRPSLAYAQAQAERLGLTRLSFAQADILGLAGIRDRFELIECSGVLHHMAAPQAGWRILRDLLAPGGVMKIGLYSRLARQDIAAARAWARRAGFPVTSAGLRRARSALLELAETAAEPWAASIVGELDAHSASTLRDMLFNVQEVTFDCDQLAAAMESLELEFLGFEGVTAPPGAQPPKTLAEWAAVEQANPLLFRAMYQFWCRPA